MSRLPVLLYGAACYVVFLLTFVYAIGFVSGIGVPRHIDSGSAGSVGSALAIDLALLGLFALQHSGMARPGFKRGWTRIVPAPIERSTYVLLSSLALILLFWCWRPLPALLWDVEPGALRTSLQLVALLGWTLVLCGTFVIDHFELFGLRQVWLYTRQRPAPEQAFLVRALYRIVRHPIMLGFLIAFWVTPTMSYGHLLFAMATTAYIFVAVKFLEERDLVAQFGDAYRDYQRRVPMLLPLPRPSSPRRRPEAAPPARPGATTG